MKFPCIEIVLSRQVFITLDSNYLDLNLLFRLLVNSLQLLFEPLLRFFRLLLEFVSFFFQLAQLLPECFDIFNFTILHLSGKLLYLNDYV